MIQISKCEGRRRARARIIFIMKFCVWRLKLILLTLETRRAGWQVNARWKVIEGNQKCYTYLSVRTHWSVADEDSSWCAISLLLSTPLAFCILHLANRLYLPIYPIFSSPIYFDLRLSPALSFIPLFSNIYSDQRVQNKNAINPVFAWTVKYKALKPKADLSWNFGLCCSEFFTQSSLTMY